MCSSTNAALEIGKTSTEMTTLSMLIVNFKYLVPIKPPDLGTGTNPIVIEEDCAPLGSALNPINVEEDSRNSILAPTKSPACEDLGKSQAPKQFTICYILN